MGSRSRPPSTNARERAGRLAQTCEELPQQFFALPGQHTPADFHPVQWRLPWHVPDTAARSGAGLVGSENDAANSRSDQRSRAHGARFQSDHQRAVFQPPGIPEFLHGFPDGEDLRVRGGVIVSFAPVHTPPEFPPVRAENHRSDGNVPGGSLRGDIQGSAHQRFRPRIPGDLRQPAAHGRLNLTARLNLTGHLSPVARLSLATRTRRALHPHRLELQLHAHQVRQLVGESQLVRHTQNLLRPVQVIVVEDDGHYLLAGA